MFGLTLEGADALTQRLEAYPAALSLALAAKAQALADALVEKVKSEKLDGEVLNVRTGALKDSIAADLVDDGDGWIATVGSFGDVKYAAIQEYGGKTGAHEILPDKGAVLAFRAGGAMRFARRVEHPGSVIPEHDYLGASLDEMRDEIVAALAATADETWEAS